MKFKKRNLTQALSAILLVSLSLSVSAGNKKTWVIPGTAVTGANDLCGSPIWDFPIHYTFLGEYDSEEGAQDSIPLTEESCEREDLVLATTTDDAFLSDFGLVDSSPRLKNIPLEEVPVIVSGDGTRTFIPYAEDVPASSPTVVVNGRSAEDFTMGEWLKVKARAKLVCRDDGTARFTAVFRDFVPNGAYTVWEVWNRVDDIGDTIGIALFPLGGIPNILSMNEKGAARYAKELPYCPKTVTAPNGTFVQFIELLYQSDGAPTAGFPALVGTQSKFVDGDEEFESTLPIGTVAHTQIIFPVNVVK